MVLGTLQKKLIQEAEKHDFRGDFPKNIPNFDGVDTEMLYHADTALGVDPFHIVLPVARVGRVSRNGLLYDRYLVGELEKQLQGSGGIRGHIKDGDEPFAFPHDEIDWIGAVQIEGVLWAKGYIPPGPTREDVRRRKARGGNIGTSLSGLGIQNERPDGSYTLTEFELERLDLGAYFMVALPHGLDTFQITNETAKDREGVMPTVDEKVTENKITAADVPDAVRQQIVEAALSNMELAKAREQNQQLQTQNEQLTQQNQTLVQEAAAYTSISASLRTYLGEGDDMPGKLATILQTHQSLAETLGTDTDIMVTVNQWHERMQAEELRGRDTFLMGQIEALTQWAIKPGSDQAKKVTNIRQNMAKLAQTRLTGGEWSEERATEAVNAVWTEDGFKDLAAAALREIAGPAPVVPALVHKETPTGKATEAELEKAEQFNRR